MLPRKTAVQGSDTTVTPQSTKAGNIKNTIIICLHNCKACKFTKHCCKNYFGMLTDWYCAAYPQNEPSAPLLMLLSTFTGDENGLPLD